MLERAIDLFCPTLTHHASPAETIGQQICGPKKYGYNQFMSSSPLTIPTSFPPFDLVRLLQTVFQPAKGEKTCVLIDLDDPTLVKDFAFLKNPKTPKPQVSFPLEIL